MQSRLSLQRNEFYVSENSYIICDLHELIGYYKPLRFLLFGTSVTNLVYPLKNIFLRVIVVLLLKSKKSRSEL